MSANTNAAHRRARPVIDLVSLVVATLLLVTAAIGWLYWVRADVAHWPGPRLANALPLDALSLHDSVPVVVFVAVFAVASILGGLGLRGAHVRPMRRGLALAICVWIVMYWFNVVSLFTVRQIPFVDALRQALPLVPAFVAAAVEGVVATFSALVWTPTARN